MANFERAGVGSRSHCTVQVGEAEVEAMCAAINIPALCKATSRLLFMANISWIYIHRSFV